MQSTIFREYDIRGQVGDELVLDEVYNLGRAIATYLIMNNPRVRTIILGADGRTHSPEMKRHLSRACNDAGLDVIYIGLCPTPVMYFAMHTMNVDAGLMITASHNTKEYNGIKMCMGKSSIWGEHIQVIKDLFYKQQFIKKRRVGVYYQRALIPTYISWLKMQFYHLVNYDIPIIFDCAHGAAATVLPLLIQTMGWKNATLLYAGIDGTFPAHEADPVVAKNMKMLKQEVRIQQAALGIGFDGDGDRMAPMTQDGTIVFGDQLLALFAIDVLKKNKNSTIVFDVKCSSGLIEKINDLGGKPCLSATGHSIIKNRMLQEHALLGGELSCHFFFADHYFGYDDGIYAALRLLSLIKREHKSLVELIADFPHRISTPEIRLSCTHVNTKTVVQAVERNFNKLPGVELLTIDGVRVTRGNKWGLIRSSNTQPMVSLRFEADTLQGLIDIKNEFIAVLGEFFDTNDLHRCFNA